MAKKTSTKGRFGHFALHTILHSFFGTFLHPLWIWLWGAGVSAVVAAWAWFLGHELFSHLAVGACGAFLLILVVSTVVQHRRAKAALKVPPLRVEHLILNELEAQAIWPEIEAELQANIDRNRIAALLRVTNYGSRSLVDVTARCRVKKQFYPTSVRLEVE